MNVQAWLMNDPPFSPHFSRGSALTTDPWWPVLCPSSFKIKMCKSILFTTQCMFLGETASTLHVCDVSYTSVTYRGWRSETFVCKTSQYCWWIKNVCFIGIHSGQNKQQNLGVAERLGIYLKLAGAADIGFEFVKFDSCVTCCHSTQITSAWTQRKHGLSIWRKGARRPSMWENREMAYRCDNDNVIVSILWTQYFWKLCCPTLVLSESS